MCRSIRVLHHFEPPTTEEEIAAAALQYVRKVSGMVKPTRGSEVAFERALAVVTRATSELLADLPPRGVARTREGEREKARARFQARDRRATGKATS